MNTTPRLISGLAGRLMRHATAPYFEHHVRAEVEAICAEHGLPFARDQFGNVLVKLRSGAGRPLVLAAHMDHPGFEILRPVGSRRFLARFRGGVAERYFRPGTRLRLMPGEIPAMLGRRQGQAKQKMFQVVAAKTPPRPPSFAVWELEDFVVRQQRIHGRACDDLIGVASVLATLITLKCRRARVNVLGVSSRAEEVGFHGALAVATGPAVPRGALVISLETSRELPGVKMGQGVILRVGDRTSIFDAEATRFLAEIAAMLKGKRRGFGFQRALMSGGTCEATAYQEFGFQTAAVCVALGNYHNCAERDRIAAEYVAIADVCAMVDLLVAAAKEMGSFQRLTGKLSTRLRQLLRAARPRLRQTA